MGPICTCVTFTITRPFFLITSKRSEIKKKIVKSWLSDWVTLFQTLMLTPQKEQSTSMNGLVDLGLFCSAILQIIPQFVLPNWVGYKNWFLSSKNVVSSWQPCPVTMWKVIKVGLKTSRPTTNWKVLTIQLLLTLNVLLPTYME